MGTKGWKIKTELKRSEIAQILDALANERDPFGGEPSALEDRLQNLLHSCDRQMAARRAS